MARPWPWEADTPNKRLRRIALSYRALAEELAFKLGSNAVAELDAQFIEYGQRWVVPQIVPYTDDDLLTADQVADYCDASIRSVYVWRAERGLPSVTTRDGIRFKFADVRKWKGRR